MDSSGRSVESSLWGLEPSAVRSVGCSHSDGDLCSLVPDHEGDVCAAVWKEFMWEKQNVRGKNRVPYCDSRNEVSTWLNPGRALLCCQILCGAFYVPCVYILHSSLPCF